MERTNEFYQEVARIAYEIYRQRGTHGHDFDDWLEAEKIVLNQSAEAGSSGKKSRAAATKRSRKA